jgi:Xaa-Pro aminopeptidase
MTMTVRPGWTGRLQRVQSDLAHHELDALVVSTPHNIFYLCGFAGSSGLLLVTPTASVLVTDGRYEFVVRQDLAAGRLGPVSLERVDRRYDLTLGALVTRLGVGRIGFEAAHVTVATLNAWGRAAPTATWLPTERIVEDMRLVKDAFEVEILRRGGRMISDVARQLSSIVRSGRAERAVAADLDRLIEAAGFTGPAFPTIVASGPNSALPHARPGDRPLAPGDLVVLDFGGVLDGYCVDVTRMAAVGPVPEQAMTLFEAVRAAHGAAVDSVRPGLLASDVDAAARSVLESRGLGEAFMHSTGHGLGLEVHEAPRIGRPDPEAPERVQPGMVFTIEPGAYLEGLGGVRVEDDVLVTATGGEVLTMAPIDLLVV